MTDATYFESLAPQDRKLFEKLRDDPSFLIDKSETSVMSGKEALMCWAIAKREPFKKSGGKFHNKALLFAEAFRLVCRNPLTTEPPVMCDHCNKPVHENDQARSKDGTLVIHMDCDPAWEEAHGMPYPYEGDESLYNEELDSDAEPEPIKPHVKLWNAPWDTKLWRLAQGDEWHSDNHCWEFKKKELFNFNTTPYVGKYSEAEQECLDGPRPRNPEWKFMLSSS